MQSLGAFFVISTSLTSPTPLDLKPGDHIAFVGNTLSVEQFFVTRLVMGLDHDFSRSVHVWLEPLNFGVYLGGAQPLPEFAFLAGGSYSF